MTFSKIALPTLLLSVFLGVAHSEEQPLPQAGDYVASMEQVAKKFHGRAGVVIHIGDSITYANPYGQWARFGKGRTDADRELLKWMHLDQNDATDGWWLARTDLPGGRSYTAASGLTLQHLLQGGRGDFPKLDQLLAKHQPQMAVFMLGTNDVSGGEKVAAFRKHLDQAVDMMLAEGCICIVSTIPPHSDNRELSASYNRAIREVAEDRKLPLIDLEKEILARRPDDWNGTLLDKNDIHLSAKHKEVTAADEPTADNLSRCGYLLRGWLSVRKLGEVKRNVLDAMR